MVLADLPADCDAPVDIGGDDLCASYQLCTDNSPPNTNFPEKQIVSGVHKWYVDFDACAPYFAQTHSCGTGTRACPWSEPGRGFVLAQRLLSRRSRTAA